MEREADSFSVGKQQVRCKGEIPNTHVALLWQSLFWKEPGTQTWQDKLNSCDVEWKTREVISNLFSIFDHLDCGYKRVK